MSSVTPITIVNHLPTNSTYDPQGALLWIATEKKIDEIAEEVEKKVTSPNLIDTYV